MKRLCDATENDPRPLLPRTKVEFLGVVGVDGVVNAVVVVADVVVVVGWKNQNQSIWHITLCLVERTSVVVVAGVVVVVVVVC